MQRTIEVEVVSWLPTALQDVDTGILLDTDSGRAPGGERKALGSADGIPDNDLGSSSGVIAASPVVPTRGRACSDRRCVESSTSGIGRT